MDRIGIAQACVFPTLATRLDDAGATPSAWPQRVPSRAASSPTCLVDPYRSAAVIRGRAAALLRRRHTGHQAAHPGRRLPLRRPRLRAGVRLRRRPPPAPDQPRRRLTRDPAPGRPDLPKAAPHRRPRRGRRRRLGPAGTSRSPPRSRTSTWTWPARWAASAPSPRWSPGRGRQAPLRLGHARGVRLVPDRPGPPGAHPGRRQAAHPGGTPWPRCSPRGASASASRRRRRWRTSHSW